MKTLIETQCDAACERLEIHLPFGLIGLPVLTRFELAPIPDSWPFQSMRSVTGEPINFVVLEPNGVIPHYRIELSDDDAETLNIRDAADALILNIVTIHSLRPRQHVTANLIGPVVVNRHTLLGKQVIIANSERYSAVYPLSGGCETADAA
jgi:flagellar assembly factor FliW